MGQKSETVVFANQLETTPDLLPNNDVYKIRIGQRLFEVSGAALNSDAPNFFTQFFNVHDKDTVLFVDRSEDVFIMIYRHLQGYFPEIKNEILFSALFTDALYFQLPRLVKLIKEYEYYFTNVGGVPFKVPKSLFRQEGNRQNYFEMISRTYYKEIERWESDKRLDFPPLQPPSYIARSPEFFQDILSLLGGAELELSENRTASLIKECRFYQFNRLEQELVKSKTTYNPLSNCQEICIALNNVSKNGVTIEALSSPYTENQSVAVASYLNENSGKKTQTASTKAEAESHNNEDFGPPTKKVRQSIDKHERHWNMVKYQRPYIDTFSRELIFQLHSNQCKIIFNKKDKTVHVDLSKEAAETFERKFSEILLEASGIKIDLSEYKVKLRDSQMQMEFHLIIPACVSICDLVVNGAKCCNIFSLVNDSKCKERVLDCTNLKVLNCVHGLKLHLSKSMWKLGINKGKIILIAVKAEAFSGTKEYCKMINFL
ncbi:hypothetical protein SMKI_12G1790 [Saccharomyces mikatae IFO 1815]|uniref:BTB domain-containing protein n=1 Tax=Saccharomyces mikatae IFO 1815 TaxID=226126 RepID=A0AA35NDQ7_SACMI|nr:uncharacterized protein SMKI_12G1790 [Saccharomyces mikatae IFO 1815]CAI4035041.1 hypothetical protein SMKI_12G1790 [Saccharomyces mikatae IFO 1815]